MLQNKQRPWWQQVPSRLTVAGLFISVTLLYCLSTLHTIFSPTRLPVPHNNVCAPKVDIMFLKTHKTASSTFLNVLYRFGEKRKLKFAFPISGNNSFLYPSNFQHTYVQGFRSGTFFNIMCNHMRFNASEVAKVLPRDTTYITILRDPAQLFESSFHYFANIVPLTRRIPGEDKMAEFLRDPTLYFSADGLNSFFLKNLLFFDFGQDNNLDADDPRVEVSIRLIDERFHLVMLAEHFEESLILLKDILCWEMSDLLFFKLNSRKDTTLN